MGLKGLRLNQKDAKKTIDLFLFSEDENQHYSLIKNFSRLTRSQITSHTSSKVHSCKKCLTHFTKKYLFKNTQNIVARMIQWR